MDETASGTLVATVAADIRASSFASFPGNPPSCLASQFIPETQDFFANSFPEPTLPSHADLDFSRLLSTEDRSSGNSSTPFAETSAPGSTSNEPLSGLRQDTHKEGVTAGFEGFELKDPGHGATTPEATAPSLSTTPPDHKSCQVCNKQFSRKHELRYVLQSTMFLQSQCVKC